MKILPKCGRLNIFIFQKITANLAREIERTASNERSAVLLYIIYCHAAGFCRVGHRRTVGAIFIGKLAQGFGIHAARIVRSCQIHFFKQRRGQAQICVAVLIAHERAHGNASAACKALQKRFKRRGAALVMAAVKNNFIADKLIKRGWIAPERSKQA